MTHPHAALVTRLYEGLRARDADAMAACYHPDATFDDPVFRGLRGPEVGAMWRMLCRSARDLEVAYRDVEADDHEGSARWEPTYRFTKKRRVHNVIHSRFTFQDGLIARQVDSFDLWRWSRMALGPVGTALGWTPMLQARIRRDAAARLRDSQTRT